jgi:yecA family protein
VSNDTFDELADCLTLRRTGITDAVELEGLLTALVIGPNTVSPTLWLPKVWGGRAPKFKDLAEIALAFDQARRHSDRPFMRRSSKDDGSSSSTNGAWDS